MKLNATHAKLVENVDAELALQKKQAAHLADMEEFEENVGDEMIKIMQEQKESAARLNGLKESKEACEHQQAAAQDMMDRRHATASV